MRYTRTTRHSKRRTRLAPVLGTGFAVVVLSGLFVYSVYEFRKPEEPAMIEEAVASEPPATFASLTIASAASTATQATLRDLTGASGTGTATRLEEDGVYILRIKSSLPGIHRESQFYEGWLVRPIPYNYFSIGDMVTNDLGEFVLEWQGQKGKSYADYTQIIVTLEAKDGNPDPSIHVLEVEFE